MDGSGGGIIEPTVAYMPLSLDWLLYDGVGDVELPTGLFVLLDDDVVVLNRNAFDNEPCFHK